jgi:hypothetical protein
MSGPGPAWQCLYSAGPVLLVQPAAAQGRLAACQAGPERVRGAGAARTGRRREPPAATVRKRLSPTVTGRVVGRGRSACQSLWHRATARQWHCGRATWHCPPAPGGPGPAAGHGVTGHPGDRVGPLTQPVSLSEALTTTTSTASPGPGRACRSGGRARPGAQSRAGSRPQAGRTRTVSDRLRLESTVATAFST